MTLEPVWAHIRQALADDLAAGRYAPGARLPSGAELARRFGVNRHTVRRALAALREEGAIHVRQGAGATVTETPVQYRLGQRTRFRHNLAAAGRSGGHRFLRIETLPAEPHEAEALGLPPGAPVHLVESVGEADGIPISYGSSRFPADRLPGLADALKERGSITAALAAEGVADYQRLWTRLSAERAPVLIARHLRMQPGAPLLHSVALNVDSEGRPIEHGNAWFCADRVQLVVAREDF